MIGEFWVRGVRNRGRGAGVAAGLWLLSQLTGCSSSESKGTSCQSQCGDLCKALAGCDVEVPSDCVSQCATGVAGADCSGARPPDQLTCAEVKGAYACADYCATLCTRAPSCGSFDSKRCTQGCAIQSPSICNPASVAARTCDQLKPEFRDYEDTARAERDGSHIAIGFGGTNRYGLCTDAKDCQPPLGCAPSTNTCSPCESDADCKRDTGAYVCSAEKECTQVACVDDDDCFGRVCDARSHECVQCRDDAQCSSTNARCNVQTATCVKCLADADCSDGQARCDVASNSCHECLTNADCTGDSPRCDPTFQFCTACEKDTDCAGTGKPVCEHLHCTVCRVDEDCKDPALPICSASFTSSTCIECFDTEQCSEGKVCIDQTCVAE